MNEVHHLSVSTRRVLVIGCGLIGSAVASDLLRSDRSVVVLTRSAPSGRALGLIEGADLIIGDAVDRETVLQALEGVDHVIYCVAGLLPAESNRNPELDARLSLPPLLNLLEALRERPARLTYLSSGGTIYGKPRSIPVPETALIQPITSYGIMKLAGEKYVSMYADLYGLDARILRCANVYGAGQRPDRSQGAVASFIHRIARGEPIVVFGDGSTVRDYVHLSDFVGVIMALIDRRDGPRIVNVGSGVGTSLNELIDVIESVSALKAKVDRVRARDFDIPAIVLDISRLKEMISFTPMPLALGIKRTWVEYSFEGSALEASA